MFLEELVKPAQALRSAEMTYVFWHMVPRPVLG